MKNKLFKTTLLFTCVASSVALANYEKDNDFWYNTRVAIDFGFGLPTGLIIKKELQEQIKVGNSTTEISASPNVNLGILASYNFPITDTFSMGPEVGVSYGFTRRFQVKNYGITFEEKYINFPLYIRMTSKSESDAFLVSSSVILGYDLNLFLSSSYKHEGNHPDLKSDFQSSKDDLFKSLTGLPKVSGSIVLGSELEFPKGFYISGKFKLPTNLFTIKKEMESRSDKDTLDTATVKHIRVLTANLVELSVGLDIMRLIQE
jgi:hypothetical protein